MRLPTLLPLLALLASGVLVQLGARSAVAQTPRPGGAHAEAPVVAATRIGQPIQLDGRLTEPVWESATPATALTQRDPEESAPVSQPTVVRILYDDQALYVGVRLTDSVRVTNRLGRRDMALLDSDWFAITLDSYHDHRTAFRFQVNPGGVQRDATISMAGGDESADLSWDAVWAVATTIDDGGWTAELRIPFSQLRFRSGAEQVWGIQLERIIGRRGEVAHFAFTPKSEAGGVPRYGHLTGLHGLATGNRIELLPYVATRGEYVDPGQNPFRRDAEHVLSAGADLLYRLTSNLTLNATVNPDFGQVEVDPAIVNLGVYETFLPERRPFFVEASEIFDFTGNTSGGDLFYSRRIGRRPQVAPPTPQADIPEQTTILGAAKLSGKTEGGWSIGVLDAVTARERARYLDRSGVAQESAAEPLANYFVARARRDQAGGRGSIGGALTSVARDLSTPALEDALRSSAWAGGVDLRQEWADRSWIVAASLAGSHVRGSPRAITLTQRQSHHYFQRPDARHLEVDTTATVLTGYSVGATLIKQAGRHWTGSVAGALTSPEYEVNDLGFAVRTDRRDFQGVLTYAENRPGSFLRDWNITGVFRNETNFDGDLIQRLFHIGANVRHLDFWRAGLFLMHRPRALDDRSTRGGPIILRPAERVAALSFSSDARRPVTFSVSGALVDGEFGGGGWEVGGSVAVRTSPRWNLSVGPYVSSARIAAQYLATVPDPEATATYGRSYLFAPLDFTHVNANVRLNVTFAPRLTLETYVQPLIFASDFGTAGALARPRSFEFEPYSGPLPPLNNTRRSVRGNAVLRWEWRPGSTIYLAWQQTRFGLGPEGRFDLGRDPRALFEPAPDNIVMLKATYWLNF